MSAVDGIAKDLIQKEHALVLDLMKAVQEHTPIVGYESCECCGERGWSCDGCKWEGYDGQAFSQHVYEVVFPAKA